MKGEGLRELQTRGLGVQQITSASLEVAALASHNVHHALSELPVFYKHLRQSYEY
jgi:hypothetical protein